MSFWDTITSGLSGNLNTLYNLTGIPLILGFATNQAAGIVNQQIVREATDTAIVNAIEKGDYNRVTQLQNLGTRSVRDPTNTISGFTGGFSTATILLLGAGAYLILKK